MNRTRKQLWIDQRFQLKFTLWVLGVFIVVFAFFSAFFDHFLVQNLGALSNKSVDDFVITLWAIRKNFWISAFVFTFIFSLVFFIFLVFVSHRIVGPIERLRRVMLRWSKGRIEGPIYFRKEDYFQPLADAYNEIVLVHQTRAQRISRSIVRLEKLKAGLKTEDQIQVQETIHDLEGLL